MKKNLLKYILIFVVATAAFITGWAFINSLIHADKTFEDGFKDVLEWILAVFFGGSCVFSTWKKDNGGDKK